MNEVINLISSLGFPVACCAALAMFIYKLINRIQDESKAREEAIVKGNKEREDKYQEIILKYGEQLSKITQTLDRLCKQVNDIDERTK